MKTNAYLEQLYTNIGIPVGPVGWNAGVASVWPELDRMLSTGW